MANGTIYLLSGGRRAAERGPDPALAEAVRATGKPSPTVAYLGSASGDDSRFFGWMQTALRVAGAGEVRLARTVGRAPRGTPPAERILRDADLVYVSGGDVEAGMRVLRERRLVPLLAELLRAGKTFCGLSAGSIMLGRAWVRWPDPDDEDCAEAFKCLGLASLVCDTHAEEDDWEELRILMELLPAGEIGYGIPTGAAVRVDGAGAVTALGGPVLRLAAGKDGPERIDDLCPSAG